MLESFVPDRRDQVPTVVCLGGMADRILSDPAPHEATVLGVTSRGIFIRVDERRVVFLSREIFRGPLTINLSGDWSVLEDIELHDLVRVEQGRLDFPRIGFSISTAGQQIWPAPKIDHPRQAVEAQRRYWSDTAQHLIARKPSVGFSAVLGRLVGAESLGEWSDHLQIVYEAVQHAAQALKVRDAKGVVENLSPMLGDGSGLTPSGDDLIAGLLLAGARWGDTLLDRNGFQQVTNALIASAYRKTTTLSANLIECASQGEADERLIAAVDGIWSGKLEVTQAVDRLAAWGNSSGVDALIGMGLWL